MMGGGSMVAVLEAMNFNHSLSQTSSAWQHPSRLQFCTNRHQQGHNHKQGSGCVNQLGEGSLADKAIFVGVSINKELQERMVHLSMRMALLVLDSLLYKPDEILLGLVEGVDGSCIRRHD